MEPVAQNPGSLERTIAQYETSMRERGAQSILASQRGAEVLFGAAA
jgi:hypothetical protein